MTSQYAERQRFPDSSLWARFRSLRIPAMFTLELTARCSLNCRHCYVNRPVGDAVARARELRQDEILAIAAQAVEMGALWCTLTGGDPLLREDFIDIYLALKRMGLLVYVFTNATLISPEHARLWREYPPRDLEVTVYGASEETYERVSRCPGSYRAFMRGLGLLETHGVPVRLKAMALRSNLHELAEIAAFCQARTKATARFSSIVHLRTDGDPLRNAEIRAERLTPEEIAARPWLNDTESCQPQSDDYVPPPDPPPTATQPLFRCKADAGDFTVSYDGQYRICNALVAPGATYNLRSGTLREAREQFSPTIRALQADSSAPLSACNACALRNRCMSCPAQAHLETGDLEGISPYLCAVSKACVYKKDE